MWNGITAGVGGGNILSLHAAWILCQRSSKKSFHHAPRLATSASRLEASFKAVSTDTRDWIDKLAVLGSSPLAHLFPALRRELLVSIYEADYGRYWQELSDTSSGLYRFYPNHVLFALGALHLVAGVNATVTQQDAGAAEQAALGRIRECWRLARVSFRCPVIHQAPLPVHATILGHNEHRLPGSKAAFIARLNHARRPMADEAANIRAIARELRIGLDSLARSRRHTASSSTPANATISTMWATSPAPCRQKPLADTRSALIESARA